MHSNLEESRYTVRLKNVSWGSDDEEDMHSAIVMSFSSNSTKDSEAMVNMADFWDEVSKGLEQRLE